MRNAYSGFSLIEAMISVLVLSVGLLGLAQLQARLSMAASRLHASAQAYVLGASGIERSLARGGAGGQTSSVVLTPATRFETTAGLTRTERLISAEFRVRWEDPSGRHEVRLDTLAYAEADVTDTRLLLPAY